MVALLGLAGGAVAQAQERGTPEEAKAMVMKSLDHIKKVGVEAAFKDFNSNNGGAWINKDVYMFALSMKCVQAVHAVNPKLIGKELCDVSDVNGVYFYRDFTAAARKGGDWVGYSFTNPVSKKVEAKKSFIMPVPGGEYYVGAGAYVQ